MGRRARAAPAKAMAGTGPADNSQQQPARKRQRVKKQELEPTAHATAGQAELGAAEQPTDVAQAKAAACAKPGRKKTVTAGGKAPAATAAAAAEDGPPKQQFFLVKSEPDAFSIDQLEARPNQTEGWDGVRNAQARNNMRSMRLGDLAFFYHSSCKVPGVVGIAKVVREAYPDVTAFDPDSQYYDASSSKDNPKWWQVDFQLVRRLSRQITLEELKRHKEGGLAGMALFNRPRLSVQLVTKEEWQFVLGLEGQQPAAAAATATEAKGRGKAGNKSSAGKQEGKSW